VAGDLVKSPKGNELKQLAGGRWREHACGQWRDFNPKRQQRRTVERAYGIAGGRQWKRLRRALRARGMLA
jgi:hypothetical protein